MQRFHQAIAITATAMFLMISPWLAGSAELGVAPAHAFGGGGAGGGAGGAGGAGGGGAGGGGGGGGAGGGGSGGGPGAASAAGAHGASTAAAATSSQTSGLGKASSVVGTTPAADDAESGLATAIGAAEGATPSPTLDRGR